MNRHIADYLLDVADLLELDDVAFKPQAYRRAAATVAAHPEELEDLFRRCGLSCLDQLPSIGPSIAQKIAELVTTGHLKALEQLQKKYPIKMREVTAIEGLGPKTAGKLYRVLKIKNLHDLERAVVAHRIARSKGLGVGLEKKIVAGLTFLKKNQGRFLLSEILPFAERLAESLTATSGVKKVAIAGSLRRWQETIGDVDFLITTSDPDALKKKFKRLPGLVTLIEEGLTSIGGKFEIGSNVDVRMLEPKSFGAGLLYSTGDKNHNIKLRALAAQKGWKLSEYGLFDKKGRRLVGRTEEEIYRRIGLAWIPPEMRTDRGEIEAALKNKLPKLIGYDDLRGDLQIQTKRTDGEAGIEEMARAAQAAGFEYIAITDHTRALAMVGGLTEKDLEDQGREIETINRRLKNFRVLKSAEINILPDGRLDIADEAIKRLDVVSVAVHSHFKMTEKEMTERIIRAIKHPMVHILFHPTGRLLKRRDAYRLDIGRLIRAAKQFCVALEANASPERLDLQDQYIRLAVEAGVKIVVNSDAHAPGDFSWLRYGLAQCRRGWGRKTDVLNTRRLPALLRMLKK